MTRLLLAMDFGGTKLTAATLAPHGDAWLRREQVYTPHDGTYNDDWRLMVGLARRVLAGD